MYLAGRTGNEHGPDPLVLARVERALLPCQRHAEEEPPREHEVERQLRRCRLASANSLRARPAASSAMSSSVRCAVVALRVRILALSSRSSRSCASAEPPDTHSPPRKTSLMTRIGPFHTLSTLSTARPFSDFFVYAVNASSPFLVEKTFHGAAEVRRVERAHAVVRVVLAVVLVEGGGRRRWERRRRGKGEHRWELW